MLKALELQGFKSFADRTRFEFPPGITTIVGPNGSGKSNVVDAIKWVLGEQSVKSLRGKEMADVIFNGSSSRAAASAAEVTLTLDNADRRLALDQPEVQITRRIYRSGESEYLINRQPSRLRDIRDLFYGTGVGADAYSVIEQGKVDQLLQSSPRDRRLVFEEASGISRFKARKLETQRRLERIEQNLLRLGDIVREVEGRLRSIRNQAAKAQRYQTHVDRLNQLRTQAALADWRTLGRRWEQHRAQADALDLALAERQADIERADQHVTDIETRLGDLTEAVLSGEMRLAQARQQITAGEATVAHELSRLHEWDAEMRRLRGQFGLLTLRAGNLRDQLRETADAVAAEQQAQEALVAQFERLDFERRELAAECERARGDYERRQAAFSELSRELAALANETSGLNRQLDAFQAARNRHVDRRSELSRQHQAALAERDLSRTSLADQQAQFETSVAELAGEQARLEELLAAHTEAFEGLQRLRRDEAVLRERADVLAEFEARREGIDAGVKSLLDRAAALEPRDAPPVVGLVADLVRSSVEHAPLIDLALGERAQHLVVDADLDTLATLDAWTRDLPGRVSLLPLPTLAGRRLKLATVGAIGQDDTFDEAPGVVGRADRLVETAPEHRRLAQALLGHVWIVERLTVARALATAGSGCDFVTLSGEYLAADGTLSIGARQATLGLVSRKSELRELLGRIDELRHSIEDRDRALAALDRQRLEQRGRLKQTEERHRQRAAALEETRRRFETEEARERQLAASIEAVDVELAAVEAQVASTHEALEAARLRSSTARGELECAEREAADARQAWAALDGRRQERERQAADLRVALAKGDERLAGLRLRRQLAERDQDERRRTLEESRHQLADRELRSLAAQAAALDAESRLAELYLRVERLAAESAVLVGRRDALRGERTAAIAELQSLRHAVRQLEESLHQQRLAESQARQERQLLADRMRDELNLELAELDTQPATDEELRERDAVDREIAELRGKIHALGNVNLEALDELRDLESRHATLARQHDDLIRGKRALEQIIARINADVRRLFAETLEAARIHFQALFRKLFGGGQADIVLEEGVDLLDAGIEIIARPPGKELRSITLLSGGEKTLTCVAVLLAIFQHRPSPFCVLDEVDAALDEANIERFVQVLREFLAWTQFIVVTHSKKTMTCATTLYGVTMQESGVSKRVSVRFEDVSETGEIRAPAAEGPPDLDGGPAGGATQAA